MRSAQCQFVKGVVLSISIVILSASLSWGQGLDASLSGGYMASFLSEESVSSYTAELRVDGPVGGGPDGLRIRNRLALGLLPGEGSIEEVDTYNSVEYAGQLSYRLGSTFLREGDQTLWTSIYLEAGFAALRKKSENPTQKESPVWMGGGIIFEERQSKAFLSVGLYADQRLDGLYQPTIGVSGGIELPLDKVLATDKVKMMLRGDAVIGIVDYGRGAGRQVRVGVMIGI